jgi:tellurite resistance protein TerC
VIGSGIEKLHYLKYGLTILLAFIGIKMLISEIIHIDVVYSLIVIFTVLGITFLASILRKSKKSV